MRNIFGNKIKSGMTCLLDGERIVIVLKTFHRSLSKCMIETRDHTVELVNDNRLTLLKE